MTTSPAEAPAEASEAAPSIESATDSTSGSSSEPAIESPAFEAGGSEYVLRLELDGFEGPLDLLLHLIQKHELNIFDVPIAFVTQEYLRYLDAMAELDLGIVGEYLVMAATLIQIKSAMLLPKPELDDGEDDDSDPREELIRRLLEYQKFKAAALQLYARPQLFRETFPRPDVDELPRAPRTIDDIEPPGLFELIDVFQSLLKKKSHPVMHEVTRHELSIKDGINRIASFLQANPRTTLTELVAHTPHADEAHRIVITFMSVLEMAKLRLVKLFQARITGDDLIVERAVIDIEEIALQLDFSDPDTVTHDTIETDVEGEEDDSVLPESIEEDDQALADGRASLRGRPRLVRQPDRGPTATALADEEDELLALAALHAEMDDYDVDAMLAQAFELSQNAAQVAVPPLETLETLDALAESDGAPAGPEAPPPSKAEASLASLEHASSFGDFVAQFDALADEAAEAQTGEASFGEDDGAEDDGAEDDDA